MSDDMDSQPASASTAVDLLPNSDDPPPRPSEMTSPSSPGGPAPQPRPRPPLSFPSPGLGSPPKSLFLIRHAESAYNAFKLSPVNWLTLRALQDPMIFDPPLSPLGLQQLTRLSELSARHQLTSRAQLLITSPLRRAIDTALAVLGPPPYPLPVHVSPLITEVLDTSADIGSPPSVLSAQYPQLAFAHLPPAWWYHADPAQPRAITDEPLAVLLERMERFKAEVMGRSEVVVVVVSHSSFIKRLTGARSKIANCAVQECRMGFARDGRIHVQVVHDRLT